MASDPPLPGVDPTNPPRLHEIGEYRFQRLVAELMGYEPDVSTSDEYGSRGQEDFGADVIARRAGTGGQEVGSCKCYEKASAAQLRDWSDEFLDHWDDHWKSQNIRRFVLATTAGNSHIRQIQDQVSAEKERFAKYNIEYEMWGPGTLVKKLRPHRTLVRSYLHEYWETQICGPRADQGLATSATSVMISTTLVEKVTELKGRLSSQAFEAAERATEDLRAGRLAAVRTLVDRQRSEENWSQLDDHAKAKLLRLAASLAIREENLEEAERLAVDADAIETSDEPRLAAHLAAERYGPSAGLKVLGEVTSVEGRQLRTSLRIMANELDRAAEDIEVLRAVAPDAAETIRMEAFLALARRDPEAALVHVQRAERIAPSWSAVRQMGGMVRYACALSPSIGPGWYLAPNAFDGAFVREDPESRELLNHALALFDSLVVDDPKLLYHRFWRLAVLASLRARRDRAQEEALDLLTRSDHHATAVAWCIFRSIDVDLADSGRALERRYREGTDEADVRVLGMLLSRADDRAHAVEVLRADLDKQDGRAREEAMAWIERLERRGGDVEAALSVHALFGRAVEDGDWKPVSDLLESHFSHHPPSPECFVLSESIAALGRFDLLAQHIDGLLAFNTAAAIRLAIIVAYKTNAPAKALCILAEKADAFGDGLPLEMRRLRAEALAGMGNVPAALREADVIAGSGSAHDRLFRAGLLAQIGNVRGALPAVQAALEAGVLTGNGALHWSRITRVEDPALARRLLKKAIETGVDNVFLGDAIHDAFSLQMSEHAYALIPKFIERANAGEESLAFLTNEDIRRFNEEKQNHADEIERLYLQGGIPVHLRFADDPFEFALIHLGPNTTQDGGLRPWPIRHGARPAVVDYPFAWSSLRLHIDITALLVAARLELLDEVELHPNGVTISSDVPMALMVMENGCRQRSAATFAERVLSSTIAPIAPDEINAVRVVAEREDDAANVGISQPFVSLPDLIDALQAKEAVSAEDAARVRDGFFIREGSTVPPDGATITLDVTSLTRLAAVNLLSTVAARFDVRCDGSYLEQARWARDQAGAALRACKLLGELRTRVATGIETGVYTILQRVRPEHGGDENYETHISRCLDDLISAPGGDGAVAWIDDRLATGYAHTATMPVLGVSDVLHALKKDGRISATRHADAINTLRAAGALFLVPSPEELLLALLPAPSRGSQLSETPDLVTMRRSLALTALHERYLAIQILGSTAHDRPDEVVPFRMAMRLLPNCLKVVWSKHQMSLDQMVAMSDWLWLNARRTHFGRSISLDEQAAGQDHVEAMQIAQCLDQAVDIGQLNDSRRQARISYLAWLCDRAVQPIMDVDPKFRQRLVKCLVDIYSGLDTSYACRISSERRILHLLLAARVQRLPKRIQTDLYVDPRMSSFGRSVERIKVGRASFESSSFWRAIQRTLKFGSARIHHRPNPRGKLKTIVLRKDDDGIRFGGALKAKLNDPALHITVLEGRAREKSIRDIVSSLALGRAETLRVAQLAVDARTVDGTIRVLWDAASRSAKSRYHDIVEALGQRRGIPLEAFAPAPFDSVMSFMGLDSETSFNEALRTARAISDASDAHLGLLKTAGIPVLRDAEGSVSHQTLTVSERARTPMALIHVLAAANEAEIDEASVRALSVRLISSIEEHGSLFVTLLHYSLLHFLRDAKWRSAEPAFALAAIWGHADRMLDIAIGSGLKPGPLEEALRNVEPPIATVDRLRLHPFPPDVAWPTEISSAALLHHGLGAAFGNCDLGPLLGEEILERASKVQLNHFAGGVAPDIKLLTRRGEWPNTMTSFLARSPVGLDKSVFDTAVMRDNLINSELDALEIDPESMDAWQNLSAFSFSGLDEGQFKRLMEVVAGDPARLVRLAARGGDRRDWWAILRLIAWREPTTARRQALQIAAAWRHIDKYRPQLSVPSTRSEDSIDKLVDMAAFISQACGDNKEGMFTGLLVDFATEWPELSRGLHAVAGNIAARTPSGRAEAFWNAQNQLAVK